MKTTFSRTFATFMVILLTAIVVVGIAFQLTVRRYLTDRAVEELRSDGAAIAEVVAARYQDRTLTDRDFFVILSVSSKISDADAVICDARGTLQLCSNAPWGCEHQGMVINSPGFLRKLAATDYLVTTGEVEGLYTDRRFVVATPIRQGAGGPVLGIVIVSAPVAETQRILQKITDTYIFISVLAVLAAVVVMTIYTRKSSNPLQNMAKTANAFGHGDLKARAQVPEGAPEEIQELALAFNNMADSLEKGEYQRKEFVANVSHELKTPMTTISGYVDGILDGTIPAERQEAYLKVVSEETKRLSRLVRSMLDISQLQEEGRIPEEKKSYFDVSECATQVLITFEKKITDKNLQVEVELPEHPVKTYACRDYITQVLYNLLDNSVKFCPEEGLLGLSVRLGQKKIYVSVSNTGEQIPAEELPLLFERFHKLDKSRSGKEGWGLGLYIVKTLVCSHGEDISVTSTQEKTEFTFTLPMANE